MMKDSDPMMRMMRPADADPIMRSPARPPHCASSACENFTFHGHMLLEM